MEEIRTLVKAEHASGLLSGVSRLRKDAFIPDFTIIVEEKSIPVHRAVLAATSGYFHAMFSHDVQEVDKGFVDMKDVTFEGIDQSIEFAYTGEADVTMGNVNGVAYAAELLQLSGLSKLCSNCLRYNLEVENCLSTKALADMYNWDELKVLAEKCAIENFEALIEAESFAELDLSDLVLYLKASEVDHKVLWKAIISWVGKFPERDNQLLCLMETAHMEEFPFSYTMTTVLQEPLVTKSTSAKMFAVSLLFCDQAKLESNLSLDNCFMLNDLTSNSETTDVEGARKGIHRFMMKNLDEISSKSEFLNLANEELEMLFESPETKYSSELSKLSSLFRWIKHERERKEFFPHLFSLVDLGQLPHTYLHNTLKDEPLLKEFPECMERLFHEFGATSGVKKGSVSNFTKLFAVLDQDTARLRLVELGPEGNKINDLPSPPVKDKPMVLTSDNGQMYLVNGNKVFLFNKDGKWAEKTTLKFPITKECKVIATRNVLYMTDMSMILCHDLEDDTFGLSRFCSGACIAIMGDFVYAIGGEGQSRQAKRCLLGDTKPDIEHWSNINQMTQGRTYASAASLEKRLYVLGGIYAGEVLDSVEYYQEETNIWTKVKSMVSKRGRFAVVSVDDKLFAIGGNHIDSFTRSPADTIEVYDTKLDSWESTGLLLPSTKSLSACEVQGWMAQVASQESTQQIFNIGPEGKEITISGYQVCFRRNTFEGETEIKLPLIVNPRDLPANMDPLAPALDFTGIPRLQTPIEVQYEGGMLLQKLPGGKWERTRIAEIRGADVICIIQQPCFIIAVARDGDFFTEWLFRLDRPLKLASSKIRRKRKKKGSLRFTTRSEDEFREKGKHVLPLEDIKREFAQKIKEKAKITQTIDPKGDDIIIHGSSLNFPPYAVKKEEEITVSLDNNPENYPPNRVAVAPILGFKPSMKFDKPVTVRMQTWYSAIEGETIPAILSSRKHGSDWKDVGEVILDNTNEVKFTVKHFCEISLGVAPQNSNIGKYTLFNDIYLQKETGLVHSSSYLDQKSEATIRGIMRGRSCAAFSTKTLRLCGKSNQKFSLKLDISKPESKSEQQEFQVQEVLALQIHSIQFDPDLELEDYSGLVKGKFFARVDDKKEEDKEDDAIVARKWPVTLDPPGPDIHQIFSAGVMAGDHVTFTAKDTKFDVSATSK